MLATRWKLLGTCGILLCAIALAREHAFRQEFPWECQVTSVVTLRTGESWVALSDNSIHRTRDNRTSDVRRTFSFREGDSIFDLAWLKSDAMLVGSYEQVRICSLPDGREISSVPFEFATKVIVDNAGNRAYVAVFEQRIAAVDIAKKTTIAITSLGTKVLGICDSPELDCVFAATQGTSGQIVEVDVVRNQIRRVLQRWDGIGLSGTSIVFSPSKNELLCDVSQASKNDRIEMTIERFDYRSGRSQGRLTCPGNRFEVAPDGQLLASFYEGSREGYGNVASDILRHPRVYVHTLEGREVAVIDVPGPVYGVEWGPQSTHLQVYGGTSRGFIVNHTLGGVEEEN